MGIVITIPVQLSITAANMGITLTAASSVIFAELHYTPGVLLQAEDRAHRIGRVGSVIIEYLIGKDTADDWIWNLVEKKLQTLKSVGLQTSEADVEVNLQGVERDSDGFSDDESFEKCLLESSDKENSLNVGSHSKKSLNDVLSPERIPKQRRSQDHTQLRFTTIIVDHTMLPLW